MRKSNHGNDNDDDDDDDIHVQVEILDGRQKDLIWMLIVGSGKRVMRRHSRDGIIMREEIMSGQRGAFVVLQF